MDPHPSPDLHSLQHQDQPTISSPRSAQFSKLIVKAISLALIAALLPFIIYHCLPLLKPIGIVVLHKLWYILRFVVITTAVSFGILNSQRRETEMGNRKEDKAQNRGVSPISKMFGDSVEQPQLEARESNERERDGSLKQTIDDDGVQMKKHISSGGGSSRTHISSLANREEVGVLHREENTEVDQAGKVGHDRIQSSCLSSSRTSPGKQRRHRKATSLDQDFQFQPLAIPDKVNPFFKPVEKEIDWGRNRSDDPSKSKIKTPRRNISFSFEYGEDWLQAYPAPPPLPPFYYETDDSNAVYSSDSSLSPDTTVSKGKSVANNIDKPKSPQVNDSGEEVASSPNEVNRRAEAFIARFHEEMRLQRLKSLERYKRLERTK